MNKLNLLDKMICGWMAIAVLAVSSVFALDAYVTFGQSVLAFLLVFMIAAGVQGMILGSIYAVADTIATLWNKPADREDTAKSAKPSVADDSMNSQEEPQTDEPIPKAVSEEPDVSNTVTRELYAEHNQHYLLRHDAERQQLTEAILNYTERTFAPFLEYDELQSMLHEVGLWCGDASYKPKEIRLRHIADYSRRLKVLDMKHYVWNIGIRLGTTNGYKGEVRAHFIKSMFPMLLSENTISSLCNQTHDPGKGFIPIDSPKPSSNEFHSDTEAA